MRAQHQIHRHVMASQPDDGVLGASTDEARLGDAGHAGDGTVRATLPAVHQLAQSFASKIAECIQGRVTSKTRTRTWPHHLTT